MLKKVSYLLTLMLLIGQIIYAQVTTSSITGTVKDNNGQGLTGATVTAVHTPSGTSYSTVTGKEGVFTLPNLRIGGPYDLTINFVGLQPYSLTGITLVLGEPFSVNAVMGEDVRALETVVVTGRARRATTDRTGTGTNISNRQIATLPTISRSITDFTRLTPQASGNSFAGRDARFNNVQIDGANLNNNFGLSNSPLPGGGGQPISLDAIEEVSVNIAPYDVRQGSFTGAGISAVTRSGTNTFRGTAYTYYRDQSFNGRRVGETKLGEQAQQKNNIYGASLGGPIIKNKLFFFVNGEFEKRTFPGVTWSPTGGSGTGNISSTPVDSLRKLSDFLRQTYGYETGAFDNFPNFASQNHKLLGKIDWNISNIHKLTLKYSDFVNTDDNQLNATSIPNGGRFTVTGGSGTITRLPNARFGNRSMSFANSNYGFRNTVRSGALELNSNFRGKFANQFIATITRNRDTRTSPGAPFPTVDIFNGAGQNYMSFGYDPFSFNNDVINYIYNATNNFTYFAGKHTLTAGATYEYQRVANMFMPGSLGYYAFNSLNDFITNQAPAYYAYTYSVVPNQKAVYSAELKIGQLGLYAQDDINVNERMKVTVGVRVDRPIYHESPLTNPAVSALSFPDENGKATNYNTGQWPKSRFYWSPRIGFRWDAEGDKNLIIRGGTGIFTGRIPFVWLTNMPTNSGMYQFGAAVTSPSRLQNFKFNPNPDAYRDSFPSTAGTSVPSNIVLIDPDFKFPQVWRTNIAFDKRFGTGWTVTAEALFTKDINAVRMRNANQKEPNGRFTGPDTRPRFLANADRTIYPNLTSAIVLENTNKGHSLQLTGQVSKNFTKGFYGSLAYTYSFVQEVTANPGSQASSVWNSNPTVGTQNDLELAYSNYAVPHRIISSLSYRFEYLKSFATTLSLFYEGAHQGNYSYVYNGDLNNDANNSTDLLYIPRDPSEIIFRDITNTNTGAVIFTAQQQSEAFFQFLENTRYLRERKGQYAERNGAFLPWYNRLDFKLLQDFSLNLGAKKHTFQFSADVLNFANLINTNWGIRNQTIVTNPLIPAGVNAQGQPTFRMTQVGGQLPTQPFQQTIGTSSTWGLQLGLRYIF